MNSEFENDRLSVPFKQRTARRRAARPARWFCLLLPAIAVFAGTVAAQDEIETSYGGIRGKGSKSLNGYGVFAAMIRNDGAQVEYARFLSPDLDRFDTIIWIPNLYDGPEQDAVDQLQEWVDADRNRSLIIIGRDFDAEPWYWQRMLQQPATEQTSEYRRRSAESILRVESQFYQMPIMNESCPWFQVKQGDLPQRAIDIGGLWSADIDTAQTEIYTTGHMTPASAVGARGRRSILLKCDGEPFVWQYTSGSFNAGKVVVVANGSFLVNYGLVNRQHRILADKLIQTCMPGNRVLILESKANLSARSGLEFQKSPNIWDWVKAKPFCYILPHFIFLGIIFCFSYFPIFGRPSKIEPPKNSDFGDHVTAVARLLKQTQASAQLRQKIQIAKNNLRHEIRH